MSWLIEYLPEALEEFQKLDNSVRSQIVKGIRKVSQNPLPDYQGGYGKPLSDNLAGLMKIKFKKIGLRVVYAIETDNNIMKIIIISARADSQVYNEAENRRKSYNL